MDRAVPALIREHTRMTTLWPSRRSVLLTTSGVLAFALAGCGSDVSDGSGGTAKGEGSDGGASDNAGARTPVDAVDDATPTPPADGDRDIDRSVPYLELSADSSGPVVDLLLDFRCPPCKGFMEMHREYIDGLVKDESVVLRIHPRPMLDARRESTFSQNAACAAAAIYAQDPALLMEFEHAMYAQQAPTGEDPDPTLSEIIAIAQDCGADETCVQQIVQRAYVPWTLEVVEPEAAALEVGTPTVIIDGTIWDGDWTQPGALEKAVGV